MNVQAVAYVVDDDPSVRESLCFLIKSEGIDVASFKSAEAFLKAYDPKLPGCLVTDVRMPGMSGLDLQLRLADMLPVIIITGYGDVETSVRALKNGAADYIVKPFNDNVFLDRLRAAIDWDVEDRRQLEKRNRIEAGIKSLTRREREVMEELIRGEESKEIAAKSHCSVSTVEKHRASVMRKINARNIAHLTAMVTWSRNVQIRFYRRFMGMDGDLQKPRALHDRRAAPALNSSFSSRGSLHGVDRDLVRLG